MKKSTGRDSEKREGSKRERSKCLSKQNYPYGVAPKDVTQRCPRDGCSKVGIRLQVPERGYLLSR